VQQDAMVQEQPTVARLPAPVEGISPARQKGQMVSVVAGQNLTSERRRSVTGI